ncbi:MAG: hypothetical protein GF350_11305 [Chitinivibrionales bacterium]|nr:hypothetical protein [Chitinivibrionales bacterium]
METNTMKRVYGAKNALLVLFCVFMSVYAQETATEQQSGEARTMSIDVKDTDIRDVVRTISKGYDLNIIMDKDVTGKVTVHLSDVPIMEGLKTLVSSLGLEVVREGAVYRIRKASDEEVKSIKYIRGKLTVDVLNMDVREFLKELSSKTAVSIVPDNNVEGKISGKLYQVDLEDGLRALLETSGFKVTKRRNIYSVTSEETARGISRSTARRRRSGGRSEFFVDYSNGLLSLEVSNGDLEDVVKAISEQSEVEIITYGNLKADVNAKLEKMPLNEALALLLGGTKYTFIEKDQIILIGDRNPASHSGQALSTSELIHLRHIKAEGIAKILPKNIQATNIKEVKEQNALLVSGTSEDIVATHDFLKKIDIPTPQVVIDVLVVEYSRDIDREFSLELKAGSGDMPKGKFEFPGLMGTTRLDFTRDALDPIQSGVETALGHLSEQFYATLRFLESENKAKILAQPSITVLNGHKANIDVSQTQYFRIVGGTAEQPTYQFRPISIGINLNITPWISRSGQITADIQPDISNPMGINEDGYPNVFKRSISTTVRLEDGETLVLGGLLRSDDQVAHSKVPFLGDIPIIGFIFRSNKKINTQTNLVIYITPHIIPQHSGVNLDEELRNFEKERKSRRLFMEESFRESLEKARAGRTMVPQGTGDSSFVISVEDEEIVGPADSDTLEIDDEDDGKEEARDTTTTREAESDTTSWFRKLPFFRRKPAPEKPPVQPGPEEFEDDGNYTDDE